MTLLATWRRHRSQRHDNLPMYADNRLLVSAPDGDGRRRTPHDVFGDQVLSVVDRGPRHTFVTHSGSATSSSEIRSNGALTAYVSYAQGLGLAAQVTLMVRLISIRPTPSVP